MNQKGEKEGTINLKKEVFDVGFDKEQVTRYVRVYLANQRRGASSTKTRGEVSGGGKKPWKQKGTGRARQGSIRAPHWVHGGIAHGPKPKDWSLKLPQKVRINALFTALTQKAKDKKIIILKNPKFTGTKTKNIVTLLSKLGVKDQKTLIVIPKANAAVTRSARNIQNVAVRRGADLNAYDILNAEVLTFFESSLDSLYKTFLK